MKSSVAKHYRHKPARHCSKNCKWLRSSKSIFFLHKKHELLFHLLPSNNITMTRFLRVICLDLHERNPCHHHLASSYIATHQPGPTWTPAWTSQLDLYFELDTYLGIFVKLVTGPLETKIGKGHVSMNLTLRRLVVMGCINRWLPIAFTAERLRAK